MSKHGEANHAPTGAGHKESTKSAEIAGYGRQNGRAPMYPFRKGEINPAVGFRLPEGAPDESYKPLGGMEINPAVGSSRSGDVLFDEHKPDGGLQINPAVGASRSNDAHKPIRKGG